MRTEQFQKAHTQHGVRVLVCPLAPALGERAPASVVAPAVAGAPDNGSRDSHVPQAMPPVHRWAQVGPGLVDKSPRAGAGGMWCQAEPRIQRVDVGLARLFPQVASRPLEAVTKRPLDCSRVWAKSAICLWLEASGTG